MNWYTDKNEAGIDGFLYTCIYISYDSSSLLLIIPRDSKKSVYS